MTDPIERSQATRYYVVIALLVATTALVLVLVVQSLLEIQRYETIESREREQVAEIMLEAQEKREQAARMLSRVEAIVSQQASESASPASAEPAPAKPTEAKPASK